MSFVLPNRTDWWRWPLALPTKRRILEKLSPLAMAFPRFPSGLDRSGHSCAGVKCGCIVKTCIYFCFDDGGCASQGPQSLILCSTDGATYTGSDPITGNSATATFSSGSGWAVTYSCSGSGNSHSWGAGNSLPLSYEDPSAAGWYVALSNTPIACNSTGLKIDCYNCIAVAPPINRALFCTISGWNLCGLSFDGTYALSGSQSLGWTYTGPQVQANTQFCTMCSTGTDACFLQLSLSLQCVGVTDTQIQYQWQNVVQAPGAASPCYPAGNNGNCLTSQQETIVDSGNTTIDYSTKFGACNFSLATGNGGTFHL